MYNDLFAINTEIHEATDDEIKGAISRITGKDGKSVARYAGTFKALSQLANLDSQPTDTKTEPGPDLEPDPDLEIIENNLEAPPPQHNGATQFHYNIQIHLPATTDISVYNAIFKSLKMYLGI